MAKKAKDVAPVEVAKLVRQKLEVVSACVKSVREYERFVKERKKVNAMYLAALREELRIATSALRVLASSIK